MKGLVRTLSVGLLVAASGVTLPAPATADRGQPDRLAIESVSNPRPQLVSGHDVLLRVTGASGRGAVEVTVNGHDVSAAFARQPDGSLLGLVTGLRTGTNQVRASARHGRDSLTVTDHPITGPVLSGPQQLPFICQTQAFGLAPAVQPNCEAPTQVGFVYKTTAGAFRPLPDRAARPADLAQAVVGGRAVPYVVRVERGTIDRAVYEIAALDDGTDPSPLRPEQNWNDRLVYTFGGGCNSGFHQGTGTGGVLNDLFLAQGYAVASSTLNVLNNNCSTVISAEAAMMVKEHFVETYGPVRHTIGWGGSGGAIQQYNIADSYPGILDGIVPAISFPDPITTTGPVSDCRLLGAFFGASGNGFTPEQQRAVAGFGFFSTCRSWDLTFANRGTATGSCDSSIPVELRWDPVTNPDGVRCNSTEQIVTQLGRDPRTGFARSPLDNIGVQYGLSALQAGTIDAEQFVQLNEAIGGFDVVGNLVPQRNVADRRALAAVYADNLFTGGGQGLATTPVIDQRVDLDPSGAVNDIHTTEWSYVIRQRMIEQGTAANHVIIESGFSPAHLAASAIYELSAMDRWLTAIGSDTSGAPLRAKVARNRPADLGDGCFLADGQRIVEPLAFGRTGQCSALYPVFGNTRLAAGAPLSMTTLKCRLHPLDLRSYPVTFSADQQARLRTAFPDGVCDYSRRGVAERSPLAPWLSYGDGSRPPVPIPVREQPGR